MKNTIILDILLNKKGLKMNIYEIVTTILSIIALFVSLISLIFSKINMNRVEKIYCGQTELSIREAITSARNRITDILLDPNVSNNNYTDQLMKSATEELLNSYEEACSKYLDKKVDKKRFKKTYFDEIKNVVEYDGFKEYFKFGAKYDSIKKVYTEWFVLEK